MKHFILVILLFIILLFSGCADSKEIEILDTRMNDAASLSIIRPEQSKLRKPIDIISYEKELWIADYNQHAIVILNEDGEYLRKIGQLGSGPLEFIHPTSLQYKNGYFYILDSGNNRIQVLDEYENYISEIQLPQLEGNAIYRSLAISNSDCIYVSGTSLLDDYAKIFLINIRNDAIIDVNSLNMSFYGRLGVVKGSNDEIIAYNLFECKKEKNNYVGFSGESNVYKLNRNKVSEKIRLPYGYTTAALTISNEKIYSVSLRWGQVDTFNLNGDYIETLFILKHPIEVPIQSYSICVSESYRVYVTDADEGLLFIWEETDKA